MLQSGEQRKRRSRDAAFGICFPYSADVEKKFSCTARNGGYAHAFVRHGVHARVAQFEDLQKTDIAAYLAAASPYGQHGKPLAELDAGKVFKSAQRYNRNAAEIQTAHERLSGFFCGFAPGVAAEEAAEGEPSQMMVGEGTEKKVLVHVVSLF